MIVSYLFYDFIDYKVSTTFLPDYTIIKKINNNIRIEAEDWFNKFYCKSVKICKNYLIPMKKEKFYSKKILVVLRGGRACSSEGQSLELFHYQEAFDVSYYLIDVGKKFEIKSKDGFYRISMKAIKHKKKRMEYKFLKRS
jgi:hypothetical protein